MKISKCEKYKERIIELYQKELSTRDISTMLPEKIYYTSILAYLKKINVNIRPNGFRGEGKTRGLFTKGHTRGFKKGNKPWNIKEIKWEVNENGCWICTSHKTNKGYPMLSKNRILTRAIYEKYNGNIPDGLFVCHRCDVPTCINPEHLFLGTCRDNIDDKVMKNRQTKGEGVKTSKLTEKEAAQIKYRHKDKFCREVARLYNVSTTTIVNIRNNKSWKHIKEDSICQ